MNTFASALTLLFALFTQVVPSPVPDKHHSKSAEKERIFYDQRQEGEWNVRADLKNFVILIIPKTSEASEGGEGLLDLLTRSHSKHHHGKFGVKKLHPAKSNKESGAETMHFIESKTAPYHVDITKSSSHLMNDEILATQSPPVSPVNLKSIEDSNQLKKDSAEKSTAPAALLRQLRSTRFSKAFVLTVPDEEFVLTKMEDNKKVVKKDGFKKTGEKKDEMVLLGAAEQCGPDMSRDIEGICRLKKEVDVSVENEGSLDRDE